ncbi:hypothetical protein HRR78_008547 [Exophiala dermatitidis]|nr:hypothetical protein HRR75_008495 [Exophiala dermatitidis]KAJ4536293.1 hypothetical protein HRR78_008547 [Exophiala dermatitidis]
MGTRDSFPERTIDRNRLNQRNFRARRQAYVQELEQRVRELEDAGVRATKEVQLAAQQVDKENQLLRWLLKTQFGVNAGQISKFLSELNYPTDFCMQSSVRLEGGADMSRVSGEPVSSLISTTKPGEVVMPRATQGSPFPTPMSSREERQQGVGIGPESPEYQFKSPITPQDKLHHMFIYSIMDSGRLSKLHLRSPEPMRAEMKPNLIIPVIFSPWISIFEIPVLHLRKLLILGLEKRRARKPRESLRVFAGRTPRAMYGVSWVVAQVKAAGLRTSRFSS